MSPRAQTAGARARACAPAWTSLQQQPEADTAVEEVKKRSRVGPPPAVSHACVPPDLSCHTSTGVGEGGVRGRSLMQVYWSGGRPNKLLFTCLVQGGLPANPPPSHGLGVSAVCAGTSLADKDSPSSSSSGSCSSAGEHVRWGPAPRCLEPC